MPTAPTSPRAGRSDPVEFSQGDLRLRTGRLEGLGHTGALQALRVARPGLGQEQAQADGHRDLAPGQRQRHERLAIGILAQSGGVLGGNAH
jgi:hypothetical protein